MKTSPTWQKLSRNTHLDFSDLAWFQEQAKTREPVDNTRELSKKLLESCKSFWVVRWLTKLGRASFVTSSNFFASSIYNFDTLCTEVPVIFYISEEALCNEQKENMLCRLRSSWCLGKFWFSTGNLLTDMKMMWLEIALVFSKDWRNYGLFSGECRGASAIALLRKSQKCSFSLKLVSFTSKLWEQHLHFPSTPSDLINILLLFCL